MADSIRQKIVDEIDTQFKTILISNGYETNLGNEIRQWGSNPIPSKNIDLALIFRDVATPINLGISGIGEEMHEMIIEVEIFAIESTHKPFILRKALADVWKAIGVDPQWSTFAEQTYPVSENMSVTQEGKIIAAGAINFQVNYVTLLFDPYNQ